MPKTRSRKRGIAKGGARKQHTARPLTVAAPEPVSSAIKPVRAPTRSIQVLVMPALAAIGCWAFAYYTFLFYRDTNSYLFAAMAALLALVWSISFFVRLRKWRRGR